MIFIKTTIINLRKTVTGYGFWVCAGFTVILCFSANIYTDVIKNDRYSVFSSLRTFDREFMLSDTSFCSFNVIQRSVSGWLSLFIPIIAAFAFIPLVCDEYEAKSVRFEIFRAGKRSFHLSRFLTALVCGGLAVTIGFAVFSVLAFLLFPGIGEYDPMKREMLLESLSCTFPEIKNSLVLPMLKTLGVVFLYGAVSAVPAITLTAVIRNKYLVLCIPFFLKYAVGQTCIKMQSQAVADYGHTDKGMMKLACIVNPDSLAYLPQMGELKAAVLLYSGGLVLAALAVFIIIQSRRSDSGE